MYRINDNNHLRDSAHQRFAQLAKLGETVFHVGDLANLWGIKRRSTLTMTLSRYTRAGLLYRIYKGLYAIKKTAEIDPLLLGVKAMHGPAYVTGETVLFNAGIINQPPQEITLASDVSKRFTIGGIRYRSRKLSDLLLFNDSGIEMKNGVRIASPARAVVDLLHYNPNKHFDAPKHIDRKSVRTIANALGLTISGLNTL